MEIHLLTLRVDNFLIEKQQKSLKSKKYLKEQVYHNVKSQFC